MVKKYLSVFALMVSFPIFAAADEVSMAQELIVHAKESGFEKPLLFQKDDFIVSLSMRQASAIVCVERRVDKQIDGLTIKGVVQRCAPAPASGSFPSKVCIGQYVRIASVGMAPDSTSVYFDHCDDDGTFDAVGITGEGSVNVAQSHARLVAFLHQRLITE